MAHQLFDFRHLTAAERAQLAVDLWDSIAVDQEELPIPAAHRAEVACRHAAYVENPDAGAPWEEVKDRLLTQLQVPSATKPAKKASQRRRSKQSKRRRRP